MPSHVNVAIRIRAQTIIILGQNPLYCAQISS
jgi:hypothetical protein